MQQIAISYSNDGLTALLATPDQDDHDVARDARRDDGLAPIASLTMTPIPRRRAPRGVGDSIPGPAGIETYPEPAAASAAVAQEAEPTAAPSSEADPAAVAPSRASRVVMNVMKFALAFWIGLLATAYVL